jgi:DegV family protein with EDD domain
MNSTNIEQLVQERVNIKMANVKIVTDSSITFDKKILDDLGVTVVPLSVMIDGVIYADSDLTGEEFMGKMANAKALPKTSQPPIGLFIDKYDDLAKDGSEILSIHITNVLSGSAEAARQASHLSHALVTVVDSGFTDQAMAFQVIKAAKMAQEGATIAEILPEIEKIKENTKLYVGISSLDNLVKGGRIGRATGFISNILNIKAIMELPFDGSLIPVSKGRGNKTFFKWFEELKQHLLETPNIKAIGISHAEGEELAVRFADELRSAFPKLNIPVFHTGSVISTHTGIGAFAIMYYTD